MIAVNCMGEVHNALGGGAQGGSSIPQSIPGHHNYNSVGAGAGTSVPNLEEELSIDKNTMETIKALYAAKERAV